MMETPRNASRTNSVVTKRFNQKQTEEPSHHPSTDISSNSSLTPLGEKSLPNSSEGEFSS